MASFFMRTSLENVQFCNWLIPIQANHWVQFIRQFSNKLSISFNLDLWKIMKLLFLPLLCILILSQSARSPSFDIRFHGSLSILIASFVEHLLIKTFCHRKYLNHRTVYNSSGHHGIFNPAVIMNKEVNMVHNINRDDKASHSTSNAKRIFLTISDYFSTKIGQPLSGE